MFKCAVLKLITVNNVFDHQNLILVSIFIDYNSRTL